MKKKKKPYAPWILLGIAGLYAGYLLGAVYPEIIRLDNLTAVADKYYAALRTPLQNHWSPYSMYGMAASAVLILAVFAYVSYYYRDFMPGAEFGTSDWENPKKLTKKLADKDKPNHILSQYLQVSTDTRKTGLNNNLLYIGGTGTGKTMYGVTPNIMECGGSYVFTDPKGELLRDNANYLKSHGYVIKVLNLVNMDQSDGYNPFEYILDDNDVVKLITNLINNTTPKESAPTDPFWIKAETLYLQALFYYVMEYPREQRNFVSLMELQKKAEVPEDGSDSELTMLIDRLAREKGENHPAVVNYYNCIRGAGDTIRSIIITVNARLAFFYNPKLQRILQADQMEIQSLGVGRNGDGKTKTALFCIIPDADKSYNFMAGILYTQIFQQLYYCADFLYGGQLPIPVELWMDEFSNGVTRSTVKTVGITDKAVA